jgi:arylsulfatase A-like enzyme
MRHPDLPSGKRINVLSSHVDFMPTILDALNILPQNRMEGVSQLSAINGNVNEVRTHVFAENNYTNSFDPGRMVRNERWKYIKKGNRTCVFDNQIPEIELSKADFRKVPAVFNYYSSERFEEELYDLENDPGELNNLVMKPECSTILAELRTVLDNHMQETDDPFKDFRNTILMPKEVYSNALN